MPFSPFGPIIAELMLNFSLHSLNVKEKRIYLYGSHGSREYSCIFWGALTVRVLRQEPPKIKSSVEKLKRRNIPLSSFTSAD